MSDVTRSYWRVVAAADCGHCRGNICPGNSWRMQKARGTMLLLYQALHETHRTQRGTQLQHWLRLISWSEEMIQ